MILARALAWTSLVATCGGIFAGCGENVVEVQIVLAESQRGFLCVDAAGDPLLARVVESGAACAVADFLRWEGTPSCRVAQLRESCCGGGCAILQTRQQLPIDVPAILEACVLPGGGVDTACAHARLSEQLRSFAWTDAPSGFVSIRVVITNQACEASEEAPEDADREASYPSFDRASLAGCVFSCPAELAVLESPLELDLDVLDPQCEAVVAACASFLENTCE